MSSNSNTKSQQGTKVPTGRFSRLVKFGSLATSIGTQVVKHRTKQWMSGEKSDLRDLLLTRQNIEKITQQLAHLRGAAMKLGQLISMDTGTLLPEELTLILSRLRESGTSMPLGQVGKILTRELGNDWQDQFSQFEFTPIAAASIGQVHRATLKNGDQVAIKIQYPGIAKSIDSDVDNVASLLSISGLIPKSLDLKPLLTEAKEQLHAEADYQLEGEQLSSFRESLENHKAFIVPKVYQELTSKHVLTMSFEAGEPIETAIETADKKQSVVEALFELLFTEMFTLNKVQTDPNFANYKYNKNTNQIILLDFGATRDYQTSFMDNYLELIRAGVEQDEEKMKRAANKLGYFSNDISEDQQQAVLKLFKIAFEPIKANGAYDFAKSDIAERISDAGMALSTEQDYWHTPPVDALFLHRKFAGLFLLATKLKVSVDVNTIVAPFLKK